MDDIRQNEKKHDRIAEIYNAKHKEIYNEYEQKRLVSTISELLDFSYNKTDISVLDFGSGTGNLALKFLDYSCKVTACDVSFKSLSILKKHSGNSRDLVTMQIKGTQLPFQDNSFDIVVTYSVLHHIPDYLLAVKEMIRVCKPGGLIYIDHEANKNRWNPSDELSRWYKVSDQTKFEHLFKLIKTGELFTFSFFKTAFNKLFIDPRYEREGDIHVWPDDHIEWQKIHEVFKIENCIRIKEVDYLMYKPKGAADFNSFKDVCNDTKYVIYRKQ